MSSTTNDTQRPLTSLPFPPVTPAHILNCSFHSWYPRFRSLTPKSRLIPLSQPFLDYLRADGIILPPEHGPNDADSGFEDGFQNDDEEEDEDPSEQWADIHAKIRSTISELGGKVMPKLNWSAPKDATWIATTNDMECRTPNDVYLLLKSSDFITHDLEHAFDGCTIAVDSKHGDPETEIHNGDVQGDSQEKAFPEVPYHLVLRKAFNLNPSLEFRCFIRQRKLIAISQREMNHFDFLFDLQDAFKKLIQEFLERYLLPVSGGKGFPDENFVVDVYIPPPHDRVWLIDINPWAPRTDPLLFSWLELLQLPSVETPGPKLEIVEGLDGANREAEVDEDEEEGDVVFDPEFRLVKRDDPEAYQFSATKYSAHKLPKEVVDASMAPGDMKNMMEEWRKVMDKQVEEDEDSDSENP
ncbi:uncharacterized protein Z520_07459 [Fonsecaea multimorphosa CBS 102226]|uniref:Uncharacterized protein n=1 Tax=Fonsecaea multimorphosa CBS 102226 TaxID=1442371 RepID=A0A0D2H4H0_9EURO|nr:uncharacterized protein Z520_07459 [Fonsecaea multimorphosa CBS 102226]KIX96740.1 hypothetical protein Z520_07459 [Fonsecaea multimorphosa CBS 102226]OAL22421.1 hypothetical protein AYO22_06978 [Fonsecaea multimorphosa]